MKHKSAVAMMKIYFVWTIICLVEAILASIPTAILAAILIPLATKMRGYTAFGGEYLLLGFVLLVAFNVIHKWVCKKIFGKEGKCEHQGSGRNVSRQKDIYDRVGQRERSSTAKTQ